MSPLMDDSVATNSSNNNNSRSIRSRTPTRNSSGPQEASSSNNSMSTDHVVNRRIGSIVNAKQAMMPMEIESNEFDNKIVGLLKQDDHDCDATTAVTSSDENSSCSASDVGFDLDEEKRVYMDGLKLLFGAGGIYLAFLYNGLLQEDVFRHTSTETDADGKPIHFKQAWMLSVVEAAANVLVGFVGRKWYDCSSAGGAKSKQQAQSYRNLPQRQFAVSGATQVLSKSFKSLALANGLSFPIATLAKSGKMAPVMAGSLLLGGASYSIKDYLQVLAIIAGTALVSMGGKSSKGGGGDSLLGIFYILLSLSLDGVTGGVQKGLMRDLSLQGLSLRSYDLMYFTNAYMMIVASIIALGLGEFSTGYHYVAVNPDILPMIVKFSFCSALGQSFIFFTIAHFDPLVCTTVTTTRKIFSVVLSILFKGHSLTVQGWSGVLLASSGIVSEVVHKYQSAQRKANSSSQSPTSGGSPSNKMQQSNRSPEPDDEETATLLPPMKLDSTVLEKWGQGKDN